MLRLCPAGQPYLKTGPVPTAGARESQPDNSFHNLSKRDLTDCPAPVFLDQSTPLCQHASDPAGQSIRLTTLNLCGPSTAEVLSLVSGRSTPGELTRAGSGPGSCLHRPGCPAKPMPATMRLSYPGREGRHRRRSPLSAAVARASDHVFRSWRTRNLHRVARSPASAKVAGGHGELLILSCPVIEAEAPPEF